MKHLAKYINYANNSFRQRKCSEKFLKQMPDDSLEITNIMKPIIMKLLAVLFKRKIIGKINILNL